jgi:hypothetical protein
VAAVISLPLAVIGAWVTRGQLLTPVAVLWVTGLWMFHGIVRCQHPSVELFKLPCILLFLSAQLYVVQRAASMTKAAPTETAVRTVPGQVLPLSLPQLTKLRTLPR